MCFHNTPVPAEHDRFSTEIIAYSPAKIWNYNGFSQEDLMSYERIHPNDTNEMINMVVIANGFFFLPRVDIQSLPTYL
jgi:hypothetical protein